MSAAIGTAVIPAAGLGTRFLPATKALPKVMLPIVDKPAIQYVVEEAVQAGLDDLVVVTGRGEGSVEDHFDHAVELEAHLRDRGDEAKLAEVTALAGLARIHYVRQGAPLGLGHAVGAARTHVGAHPFAVLLGDELMVDGGRLLGRMIDTRERHGGSVIALTPVAGDAISAYGAAAVEPVDDGLVRIVDIVEKPDPDDAPSDLATSGRYVFGPEVFDALDDVAPAADGEVQLTDAIAAMARTGPVHGCVFHEGRYDIGNKVGFLRANLELALARDDLGPELAEILADLPTSDEGSR